MHCHCGCSTISESNTRMMYVKSRLLRPRRTSSIWCRATARYRRARHATRNQRARAMLHSYISRRKRSSLTQHSGIRVTSSRLPPQRSSLHLIRSSFANQHPTDGKMIFTTNGSARSQKTRTEIRCPLTRLCSLLGSRLRTISCRSAANRRKRTSYNGCGTTVKIHRDTAGISGGCGKKKGQHSRE